MDVTVEPDEASFRRVTLALLDAADGRELMRDLERQWRAAANVAANDARRSARAIAAPRSHHEVSLRAAIAKGVAVHTYMGLRGKGRKVRAGGDAEVAIKYHRSPMAAATRGKEKRPQSILWRAGWLLNRGRLWSHPVFGREPEVVTGVPQAKGWFDDSIAPHIPGLVAAVRDAYADMVDRIERRSGRVK